MASWISTVSAVGMAIGPPLVYVDQAVSIVRKKRGFLRSCNTRLFKLTCLFTRDSTGFSRDVCAIFLPCSTFAFDIAPRVSPENFGASSRPLSFWEWHAYTQYIEFLAGFILCSAILFLIFGRSELYVTILGFVALGLESTLPIPQLISNYKQRSLYGFRASTLLGWAGGDSFK
ncbi:hypothetical protein DFH29DRAFT_886754 [Suillus ampliporus]|nr:hypothetical protein DFH29DRAFT_886754 [Suillus ampliporus]